MRHGNLRQSREGRASPRPPQGIVALRRVEVVRTYLALDDPAQLRPARPADESVRIVRRSPCPVALYRRLYRDVGEQWYWHDRLEWSDEELAAHLESPDVGVWELLVDEESAGYFELQWHDEDSGVEIAYFGLIDTFIGRGLGGWMLTRAVQEAWAMARTKRVWLHTCTLDSPNALPAYMARGFREFKRLRLSVDIEGTKVVAERLLSD